MTQSPAPKFAILSTQRSGSAWLVSTLNGVEDTTVYGELFLRRRRAPKARTWSTSPALPYYVEMPKAGLPIRPFSVFSYLNHVYDRPRDRPGDRPGAVGFKIMYKQLRRHPEVIAYFVRHRVRVLHLVRSNHLDAVISNDVRRKTGRAHAVAGEPTTGPVKIELDPGTLVHRLARQERAVRRHRRLLRVSRLPHLEVSYEDLCRGASHFNPIWDFLCINPSRELPESNLIKMRSGSHADVLRNYGEVKAALAQSAYASLIE